MYMIPKQPRLALTSALTLKGTHQKVGEPPAGR